MSSNTASRAGERIAVCWPNNRIYYGVVGTRTKKGRVLNRARGLSTTRTTRSQHIRNTRRIKWEDSTLSEFDLTPDKQQRYPDLLAPGEWCSVSNIWRDTGCVPQTLRADSTAQSKNDDEDSDGDMWNPLNHCSFQRSFLSIRPTDPDGSTHADHYARERGGHKTELTEHLQMYGQAFLPEARQSVRRRRRRQWYVAESSTEEWRRKRARS